MIDDHQAISRTCQSCQQQFEIAPEDFAYYTKIAVPPPTFCPMCRIKRRTAWRNEWHLFKKKDERTGEEVFSSFSPDSAIKIYDSTYWFSDAWDPRDFGRDYDFTRPFFEQIRELLYTVPLPSRAVANLENSDYAMNATGIKNCYLVRASNYTEDSAYLVWDFKSRNCLDCHMTSNCELCYDSLNLSNCYRTLYSVDCEGCRDTILSKDCVGCTNCFGCVGLRNKEFHIFNEPYSKEDYLAKLKELGIGSFKNLTALKVQAYAFWLKRPMKYIHGNSNVDVTGDYVYGSKNAKQIYRAREIEDSRYCQNILGGPCRDCYDFTSFGDGAELIYEALSAGKDSYNIKFCWYTWVNNRNLQYSIYCQNSSDLFGCVGLRQKQYCIFNKQYSKEDYEALVPKIIQHMHDMPFVDQKGRTYRYGEFFPEEFSPVEYNVSYTHEFFPLNEEETIAQGHRWLKRPERTLPVQLTAEQLPDALDDSAETLVGQVIECEHAGKCNQECTVAFQIIPQEIAYLMEQGLPLPRLCPNCRHYERIKFRSPMTTNHRQCMCEQVEHASHQGRCSNEFETSYASDAPEIVYCESCYQQTIS
jgi:hypothetical protein